MNSVGYVWEIIENILNKLELGSVAAMKMFSSLTERMLEKWQSEFD